MSSAQNRLPVEVDPFRLAETGRELNGVLPLSQMKRLSAQLSDNSGVVKVDLKFGIDQTVGARYLTGKLEAELPLICQRCLEQMMYPVSTEMALGFVQNDLQAEKLAGSYEPYVVESVPVILRDMIEDELLLSLPQIPMHELDACEETQYISGESESVSEQVVTDTATPQDNPFAILKGLKDTE